MFSFKRLLPVAALAATLTVATPSEAHADVLAQERTARSQNH